MSETEKLDSSSDQALFDRVISILEQARGNVVRAVNSNMVMAYWLIGREIVQDLQDGEERAEYGKQLVADLSKQLIEKYGKGFSITSLKYFRTFYQVYADRFSKIDRPSGDQSQSNGKGRQWGALLESPKSDPKGSKSVVDTICFPVGSVQENSGKRHYTGGELAQGFSPQLSWSHYRALMRVENLEARDFYEREAIACGWSKTQLERQIHSFYYDRIVANQGKQGLLPEGRERLPGDTVDPTSIIKSPFVLEFLGLPDPPELHESKLEQAIIDNLQNFLLELGKGFSFVARQKHIRFDDDDFYIDLVFYNYILKCFLLIDLKMGKLKHADIGQMDGYVRLYEDQFKIPGDNPTIGLILCSEKSEATAKYSILHENRQIFASKYLPNLPSEEQLQREIERERRLIEATLAERELLGGGE
jgi:predicted nuclease of restriction endonuclease-like (RecB) superfamily